MGLEELLQTLRKNEQQQIEEIWEAAQKEAAYLRTQVADAMAEITQKHDEQLAAACQQSMRAIFSEAATRTREKDLLAGRALEQKLRQTAFRQLPLLRRQGYDAVFSELVSELPQIDWERIVVNPDDTERAACFFRPDIIIPDPAVSGGLVAMAANGRITVDNTFEKRLERKWPDMLPTLLTELEQSYGTPGTAENVSPL